MILSQCFLNSVLCNIMSTSSHSSLHIVTETEVKGQGVVGRGNRFPVAYRRDMLEEVCMDVERQIHGPPVKLSVLYPEERKQLTVRAKLLVRK